MSKLMLLTALYCRVRFEYKYKSKSSEDYHCVLEDYVNVIPVDLMGFRGKKGRYYFM